MEEIIVHTGGSAESPKTNILQNVSSGEFFEKFIDSQRRSESKPKGLSPEAVAIYRAETTDVLNHCNPHDASSNPETTHLVVG